ncbi:hypothetical protein [Pararhizobium sp. A13]|uniref:hypothetical protein n=1 Tax=Pararhizobium sp. A13 TaxID=3133975 RepID=UPI00311B1A78
MTTEAPRHRVTLLDRDASCQEAIECALRELVAEATTKGWSTIETITAVEEGLKRLRLSYAEGPALRPSSDPDPSNDWPAALP